MNSVETPTTERRLWELRKIAKMMKAKESYVMSRTTAEFIYSEMTVSDNSAMTVQSFNSFACGFNDAESLRVNGPDLRLIMAYVPNYGRGGEWID